MSRLGACGGDLGPGVSGGDHAVVAAGCSEDVVLWGAGGEQ